jgi:uncharacterized protein YbjT (DUF2867 family)
VEAALVNGAAVVAVASGTTPAARLSAAGADVVLDDLTDTARVLAAISEASAAAVAPLTAPRAGFTAGWPNSWDPDMIWRGG